MEEKIIVQILLKKNIPFFSAVRINENQGHRGIETIIEKSREPGSSIRYRRNVDLERGRRRLQGA